MKQAEPHKSDEQPQQIISNLLKRIISEIIFHPEDLKITPTSIGRSWTIRVMLHRADTPRCVGKGGNHIKSMDKLANLIGAKNGVNVRVMLSEPEVGKAERYAQFKPSEKWNGQEVAKLAKDVGDAIFASETSTIVGDVDGTTSSIEMTVSRRENKALVSAVQEAMQVLFNAIGKANGRILFLDIVEELVAPAPSVSHNNVSL